ncbi:MAG: caspase family protein [Cyanophyceae cyanobacterium]
MAWTRREVLKLGGAALAGLWGGAIADIPTARSTTENLDTATLKTGQALAASSGRKRAVLVGINRYPKGTLDWTVEGGAPLKGCLTDVELVRDTLISRFGFAPGDIVTLTDSGATREEIQEAIAQTFGSLSPQDTAVFHFSGCGTEWQWGQGDSTERARALVPADGQMPGSPTERFQDLPVAEVLRSLNSVGSRRAIAVIDASYGGGGGVLTPGIGRGRSRLAPCDGALEEIYQGQNLGRPLPWKQWPQGVVVEAGLGGDAVELPWGKVWAGALTYQLVQGFWQLVPPRTTQIDLGPTLAHASLTVGDREIPSVLGRVPFDSSGPSGSQQSTGDFPLVPTAIPTEAAGSVIGNGGDTPRVQLAGLDPLMLYYTSSGSVFEAIAPDGKGMSGTSFFSGTLTKKDPQDGNADPENNVADGDGVEKLWLLRDRQGLKGNLVPVVKGPDSALVEGQQFRECGRLMPASLSVVVAVDNGLERIERVDAISALTGVANVEIAADAQAPADIAFGRHREGPLPGSTEEGASYSNRYGLFSVDGSVIPSTLISGDEAVKVAVQRMALPLKSRLAEKWLHLTDNCYQSAIPLQTRVVIDGADPLPARYPFAAGTPPFNGAAAIAGQTTAGRTPARKIKISKTPAQETLKKSQKDGSGPHSLTVPTLPVGAPLRIDITSECDRPLYPLVFAFDAMGGAFGYVPSQSWSLEPGTVQTLFKDSPWILPSQQTTVNSYVLVSQHPWTQVREQWEMVKRPGGGAGMVPLENPVALARAAISDLAATCAFGLPNGDGGDRPLLNLRQWVSLRLSYRVV